jgi:hypothetical protein
MQLLRVHSDEVLRFSLCIIYPYVLRFYPTVYHYRLYNNAVQSPTLPRDE